jgi:Fibronectin type III-like domain
LNVKRRTIRLTLPAERLAYWDAGRHSFVVEPDRVELLVGGFSADIRLRKIVAMRD